MAIIQLAGHIPLHLRSRVDYVCLSFGEDFTDPPLRVYYMGWGYRSFQGSYTQQYISPHLMYAQGVTRPLPGSSLPLSKLPYCQPRMAHKFCIFSPKARKITGDGGDGGSPAVVPGA